MTHIFVGTVNGEEVYLSPDCSTVAVPSLNFRGAEDSATVQDILAADTLATIRRETFPVWLPDDKILVHVGTNGDTTARPVQLSQSDPAHGWHPSNIEVTWVDKNGATHHDNSTKFILVTPYEAGTFLNMRGQHREALRARENLRRRGIYKPHLDSVGQVTIHAPNTGAPQYRLQFTMRADRDGFTVTATGLGTLPANMEWSATGKTLGDAFYELVEPVLEAAGHILVPAPITDLMLHPLDEELYHKAEALVSALNESITPRYQEGATVWREFLNQSIADMAGVPRGELNPTR